MLGKSKGHNVAVYINSEKSMACSRSDFEISFVGCR